MWNAVRSLLEYVIFCKIICYNISETKKKKLFLRRQNFLVTFNKRSTFDIFFCGRGSFFGEILEVRNILGILAKKKSPTISQLLFISYLLQRIIFWFSQKIPRVLPPRPT